MKIIPLLIISMLVVPAYGQNLLQTLLDHKPENIEGAPVVTPPPPAPVGPTNIKTTEGGKSCEDLNINEQRSVPLKVITSLIQQGEQKLKVSHDPVIGTLTISSGDMIGNCNSMLDWKIAQTALNGENAYTVEAKIKQGSNCTGGLCSYRMTKMRPNGTSAIEDISVSPNFNGFLECLKKSGVFTKDSKQINKEAIRPASINVTAKDIRESGKLLFLSEGLESNQIGPKYGKFVMVSDCKYFENIQPQAVQLMSEPDELKAKRDRDAQELLKCGDYHKVNEFLEKYQGYHTLLGEVRDRLIKEAAAKSAQNIAEGKGTEDDINVLNDFKQYILDPMLEQAALLAEEWEEAEGDEKNRKAAQLQQLQATLATYAAAPYFHQAQLHKLVADGKFDQAEKLKGILLTVQEYGKLGKREGNGPVVTRGIADQNVENGKQQFAQFVEKERERYEIRTGQVTGNAQMYAQLASRLRRNIQTRTQNYMMEIQEEYLRLQPGGYCMQYYRNTQKCIQETMEVIQQLQITMARNNNVDRERAAEFDKKAQEYRALEEEGRRYVASQGGTPVPETPLPQESTPHIRYQDNTPYPFPYNPASAQIPQGYLPQMQPTSMMNPVSPYAYQNMFMQQPNPYMYQDPYMYQQNPYALGQQPYMNHQPFMGQAGAYAQLGMQTMNPMMMVGPQQYMGLQQPSIGGNFFGFNIGMPNSYGQPGMPYGQQAYSQPPTGLAGPQGYWGQPWSGLSNYSMY